MAPHQDGIGNGESQRPLTPSEQEAARLKALFQSVEPIEITGLDLTGKTPQEIARLLPRFTTLEEEGGNPACGILVDVQTRRAFAFRSGYSPDKDETLTGITFKRGTMTKDLAATAGPIWKALGSHVEGQAAAFMWKTGILEAILYINASTPCRGQNNVGCLYLLPVMLPPGASLSVYNKNGRLFPFSGSSAEQKEINT